MRTLKAKGLICAMMLGSSLIFAAGIDVPVTAASASGSRIQRDEKQMERYIAPAEAWRVRAAAAANTLDVEQNSADFFDVIRDGHGLKVGDRIMLQEFGDSLSDEKLSLIIAKMPEAKIQRQSDVLGRERIIEEVLTRSSLSQSSSVARWQKARLQSLHAAQREPVVEQLQDIINDSSVDEATRERAGHTLSALTNPISDEDFAEWASLMDVAVKVRSVQGPAWLGAAARSRYDTLGREGIISELQQQITGPMIGFSRCSLEIDNLAWAEELEEIAQIPDLLQPDDFSECIYWLAMGHYAKKDHPKAAELFELVLRTNSRSDYASFSCMRLAESQHLMRHYSEAGVYYLETIETYGYNQLAKNQATTAFRQLIDFGLINESSVRSKALKRRGSSETAMTGNDASEGGTLK